MNVIPTVKKISTASLFRKCTKKPILKNNEFIAKIQENGFVTLTEYAPIPDNAIKYRPYDKAIKASKKCHRYETVIGYLFDLEEQHILGFA